MSTHRSSTRDRSSRKLTRRERLQLSTARMPRRPVPPLPRLGPDPESSVPADDAQPEQSPTVSASRAGLWVGGILTRVGEQREHPFWASWFDAASHLLPRRSPFSWRERDWRGSAWGQRAHVVPIVGALLIALLVAGTFAVTLATHAAGVGSNVQLPGIQSASAPPSDVLRPLPPAGTATPAAPQYLIGTWVSGSTASGSVKVFARVTHGDAPVAHVPVSVVVNFPGYSSSFGPGVTDADGVASIVVTYGGLAPNQPVFITASATIDKQTVSAQTTFVTQ